jgi:hypothetical protein
VSEPIQIITRPDGRTEIRFSDWPDRQASWRISTVDNPGRELAVVGLHFARGRFRKDERVGEMRLHVEGRRALTIKTYELADSLVGSDRAEALAAMVLCAQAIAAELDSAGIGNGCVDWQFDHRKTDVILRQFPAFEVVRHTRARFRGQRVARWRPPAD